MLFTYTSQRWFSHPSRCNIQVTFWNFLSLSSNYTKTSGQLHPCAVKGLKKRIQENKKGIFPSNLYGFLFHEFVELCYKSLASIMSCTMISTTYLGVCTNILLLIETFHLIISLTVPGSCFRRNSKQFFFLLAFSLTMMIQKCFHIFPLLCFP